MNDSTAWLNDDEEHVWRRWLSLNATLPAALHRALQAEAGLSLQDFEVLVRLTDTPDGRVRVSDLARDMLWERSRLSHHVTRMEGRGLVVREECPEDRRGAFVVLTDRGREAIERAAPGHVDAVRRMVFDGISAEDLAVFTRVVDAITERVEAEGGETPRCPSMRGATSDAV